MSADTMNLRPEFDFNQYIDVTDNISINLADLDYLKPPILNLNECGYYDERSFLDFLRFPSYFLPTDLK